MAPLPRLIALTPGDLDAERAVRFLERFEPALAAGLPGVLLREPGLDERATLALGGALGALRARFPGLWLGLHDRAHLAHSLRVDAVHLSFRSLRPSELRAWLGPGIALGLSTHAPDDPRSWLGADYVFHGPLHTTQSKAMRQEPLGFEGLARAGRVAACPVLALGGVGPADLARLRREGMHGAAVLSGVFGSADPARATRAYLEALR